MVFICTTLKVVGQFRVDDNTVAGGGGLDKCEHGTNAYNISSVAAPSPKPATGDSAEEEGTADASEPATAQTKTSEI